MFEYSYIESARNNLLAALLSWRCEDGLWRSLPDKPSTSPISYTCSAKIIQAFVEAEQRQEATLAAKRLDARIFENGSFKSPPFEATGAGAHTVNLAWTTFVLQETQTRNGNEIWPAIDRLISSQEDGLWPLVPKDLDNRVLSPIFDSYSMVAIAECLKFQQRCAYTADERLPLNSLRKAEECLRRGMRKLYEGQIVETTRTGELRNSGWWPIRRHENRTLEHPNFQTTLLCLHAIRKSARVLGEDHHRDLAFFLFERMLNAIHEGGGLDALTINGQTISHREKFHAGKHNYHYGLYAPICCVTILGYIESCSENQRKQLVEIVYYFLEMVFSTMPIGTLGELGVYSHAGEAEISTWATADAVIVLSRVLKHWSMLHGGEGTRPPLSTGKGKMDSLGSTQREYARFDNCVAVYCPLQEERQIFLEHPGFDFAAVEHEDFWWECEFNQTRVLLYQSAHMGRVPAALDTIHLLSKISPKLIISTGICGGFEKQDVRCGDVIVPLNIIDLAKRKITEDEAKDEGKVVRVNMRPVPIELNEAIHRFIKSRFDEGTWLTECLKKRRYKPGTRPTLIMDKSLISTDEVVASEEWTTGTLLENWPTAVGVEMELGGVAAAAKYYPDRRIPIAVVKGVSDLSNVLKSDDEWRGTAMNSAVELIRAYLLHGVAQ